MGKRGAISRHTMPLRRALIGEPLGDTVSNLNRLNHKGTRFGTIVNFNSLAVRRYTVIIVEIKEITDRDRF